MGICESRRKQRLWPFALLMMLLLTSAVGAASGVHTSVALEQMPRCGAEEHIHTSDCYINGVLTCEKKAHVHTKSCYLVLLEDNDINTLLTQVDDTAGRSLERVIAETAAGSQPDPAETASPSSDGSSLHSLSARLVFNEGLRVETLPDGQTAEGAMIRSLTGEASDGEQDAVSVPQSGQEESAPASDEGEDAASGSLTADAPSPAASQAARAASLAVAYTVNWSTPSELRDPSAVPTLAGASRVTVADGETLTVSSVSQRVVSASFTQRTDRYGSVYFMGWQTETGELLQPSSRVSYEELASYDKNGDGTVRLTGVWNYHQLQSVNFFVKLVSANASGETTAEYYTDVLFTTYAGGLEEELSSGESRYTLNDRYAINAGRESDYLNHDKRIRALYGSSTTPWLVSFPDDADIFEALKKYARNGVLRVPNDAGELEDVQVDKLSEEGYAIRWYMFQISPDGSYHDWHIDGALVRKEGKAHVSKTFAGNSTLISESRERFYIHAANAAGTKQYLLTTEEVSNARKQEILKELGLSAAQVKAWITPMDDGDGDDRTLLWEFGDLDYNEAWTVTEHPPALDDTMSYSEWKIVDASALNQSASGSGHTVRFRGVTQATDLDNPEWLRVEFNNIYFRKNSLMLKKEDASTGYALAGAEFQFYQNGQLMTFDFNEETGLYEFNEDGAGAVSTLTCDGYTNVSTTGFSYDAGDLTIREVTVPTGYNRVDDVTVGFRDDGSIGITNDVDDFARYGDGLLVIRNSSDPIRVTVTKEWDCADNERTDVTMQLLANGSANMAAAILQERGQPVTVTLTRVDGWTYTWQNLPVYASGGPVTWSVRETRIGSENCKADYTFPSWIASYRSRTQSSGILLTVTNSPKRPMLYLEKRDLTGKKLLEGAEFTLTAVDADGNPVAGAVTKTAVTGQDGTLSFDNLRYNTRYRLTETQAPSDYLPFTEPAYLTITESGTVEVEDHGYVFDAGTPFHIRVLNRGAYSLPETGGPGTRFIRAAGAALTLTALWAAGNLRRKREEGPAQ